MGTAAREAAKGLAGRIAFIAISTAIAVIFSEKMYWYTQGYREGFILELLWVYLFPTFAFLWAIEYFHVRRMAPVLLCGIFFGFMVEGVIVPVIYKGGHWDWFSVSYTPMAWHGPITIFIGWYYLRRCLIDRSWKKLAAICILLGIFWGLWSLYYWLPRNLNDAKHLAQGWRLGMWPVQDFALFVFSCTGVLVAAQTLWGAGLWMKEFKPTLVEKLVVLWVGFWWFMKMSAANGGGQIEILLPAVVLITFTALRAHQYAETGPTVYEDLAGPIHRWRVLLLFIMPAVAVLVYGVAVAVRPPDKVIEAITIYGIIFPQAVLGWIFFVGALLVCFTRGAHVFLTNARQDQTAVKA